VARMGEGIRETHAGFWGKGEHVGNKTLGRSKLR
jgi:hypothetical protein